MLAPALTDPSSSILVTGANGRLGRRLLRRLAQERPGVPLRALVRSQRAADSLADVCAQTGATVDIVDYGDATRLTEAATGARAAIHLVGILKETRQNRYADAHEHACQALAQAAQATGLSQVVYLSILGSRPDSSNACLASKGRAERILLEAATPALVLRVPMVLGPGDPASEALRRQAEAGSVRLIRGGATREQPIAADDVVQAVVSGLGQSHPPDAGLDLAGPESLSHRALVERAAAILGREVTVRSLPLFAARALAAVAERLVADPPLTRAMLGVLEHDDDIDPKPACERLGIELTPLDETLRLVFAAGGSEA
jgi:NADH dehydrogenase